MRFATFAVAVLALVLGACSGRTPEADLEEGAGPRVVLPDEPQDLDPRFVADAWGLRVSRLIFASLVTLDPQTLAVVPDLAEQVEVLSAAEYLVTLRPGLRFSDGSVLDAEDVAATYRGIVSASLGSRYAGTYGRIARIEVEGARHIRFFLEGPHASFLTDLELPIVRSEDAMHRMREAKGALVGAGPYRLVKRRPGVVELEANPHFHLGEPRFARLRFRVIRDDNTRALRLLGGRADIAMNAIPPLLLPLFERDPAFEVSSAPGPGTTYLGFELEADGVSDLKVREAVAHAIDRHLLVETKLNGRAVVASGFVPEGHWAFAPTLSVPDYDPDAARRLLDEAGYPDPPGPEPRLRLALRVSTERSRVSMARAIAAMLDEVGIEVDVRPSESASMIADLNAGRFAMALMQLPELFEPHLLSWFFGSDRIPGPGAEGANRWRLRSARLDAALERGRVASSLSERRRAYLEVQRILAATLPALPLFQEHVTVVARKGLDIPVPRDGRLRPLAR